MSKRNMVPLCLPALLGRAAVGLAMVAATAGSVNAQMQQILFRADDGTAYQVLRAVSPLGAGADAVHITTIGGSANGVASCVASSSTPGSPISAIGGAHPPVQVLHAYGQIERTVVLSPNDIAALTFDPSFGGRVTLGTGGGALNVCGASFDCAGQPNTQALDPLSTSSGGVPAACIANGVAADCDSPSVANTFAFGLAQGVSPPTCDDASQATVNTTLCAAPPSDGFALTAGQAIVFIYGGSLGASAFSTSFGGFLFDTNGVGSICPLANEIVASVAGNQSSSAPEQPTPTPATTSTQTPTATPSPLCPATPGTSCYSAFVAADRSRLVLKDHSNDARDRLVWRWLSIPSTIPIGVADYALCIYGTTAGSPQLVMGAQAAAPDALCGGVPCWQSEPDRTRYRDRDGTADGITAITISPRKITVKGKGPNLPMPTPADPNNLLSQDAFVIVQLVNSAGVCWGATYPAPAAKISGAYFTDAF